MSWFTGKKAIDQAASNIQETDKTQVKSETDQFEKIETSGDIQNEALNQKVISNDIKELINQCDKLQNDLEKKKEEFSKMLKQLEEDLKKMDLGMMSDSQVVDINVGGTRFAILKKNILKKIPNPRSGEPFEPSLLEALVNKNDANLVLDSTGAIFIDRSPKYFDYILEYLRRVNTDNPFKLPKHSNDLDFISGLHDEAEFYKVHGLKELLSRKNLDTNIINSAEDMEKFIELLKPVKTLVDPSKGWKLLYRATNDGFEAENFHKKCDGRQNTVAIFKAADTNHIFGGFTSVGWKSSGGYRADPKAFIFSLTNRNNEPELMMCTSSTTAVLCSAENGPVFGAGHDIYIANKADKSNLSYSRVGNSYRSEKYSQGSYELQYYLAGLANFVLSEMEVFEQI